MNTNSKNRRWAAAAALGLLSSACQTEKGPAVDEKAAPVSAPKTGKDCCMGKNDCKGKGGCAVPESHACAGKNDCAGKGGCNMHCPK